MMGGRFPFQALRRPVQVSFLLMALALIMTAWLHLGALLLAVLFSYFALNRLRFGRLNRWIAVAVFILLVAGAAYGLGFLINSAVRALPDIAEKAVPAVINWAQKRHIELPFSDYDSLREMAVDTVKSQAHYIGSVAKFARGATTEFILVLIGCIIAIGIFFRPALELEPEENAVPDNLYSLSCEAIGRRFRTLYQSFATVMGAQIVISAINTVLTGIFAIAMRLPYAPFVIGATFFCGLVPVVGNLISNSIIVGIGITVSPKVALICFLFLVLVHKLEYFLNSKIVGDRIRNPFWLTLLGLIIGEKLMGVPGMVLAPVVLNYIKLEACSVKAEPLPVAISPPEEETIEKEIATK